MAAIVSIQLNDTRYTHFKSLIEYDPFTAIWQLVPLFLIVMQRVVIDITLITV